MKDYILQEKNHDFWFDLYYAGDFEFLVKMRDVLSKKNSSKYYRIIEVIL